MNSASASILLALSLLLVNCVIGGTWVLNTTIEVDIRQLEKRNDRLNPLVLADSEFVKKAQIIGLFGSLAGCPSQNVLDWSRCNRCRKYTKVTAQLLDHGANPVQGEEIEKIENFEIIKVINMQKKEYINGGIIAVQHEFSSPQSESGRRHPLSKSIIVSYPGSIQLGDWIDNFKTWRTQFNSPANDVEDSSGLLTVHRGFQDGFTIVWPQVQPILAKLLVEYPEYQVIVIGQSRGAPLAIFTSMELISSLNCAKERIETWMYGSPRFASSGLVKRIRQMNLKLYNVHYDGDPVTHLPPYGLGFYHIPPIVYVVDKELDPQTGNAISKRKNPRNTYICDPSEGEDPRCSYSTSLLDMVNGPHHQRYRDWEIFGEQLAFSPPKTCVEK